MMVCGYLWMYSRGVVVKSVRVLETVGLGLTTFLQLSQRTGYCLVLPMMDEIFVSKDNIASLCL